MAKGFDVLNVKSAVKSRNKFDLSRTHLTTLDFGQIMPLFVQETVPGDKFNVSGSYFSRMAPLTKPTYGKFSFRTMSAFVPYHQVCASADAFISGAKMWEGETPTLRWITPGTLLNFSVLSGVSTSVDASQAAAGTAFYDFTYITSGNIRAYYRFTAAGKLYWKILNALGYTLSENINLKADTDWNSDVKGMKLNSLPLLAFAKAYNDWMSQSQKYNTSSLSKMLRAVRYNKAYTNSSSQTCYNASTNMITEYGILEILKNIVLCYENGYFTSAWQSPNCALYNTNTAISFQGGFYGDLHTTSFIDGNGDPWDNDIQDFYDDNYLTLHGGFDEGDGYTTTLLSQRSLDFLKSFDDYVRRNNYSGSRIVQQIYSRFGIKTEDYKNDYAHIIDTTIVPVNVGDVTATADATDVPLGDYAGKGITSGDGGFQYESKDFGMLFILGWYQVDPMDVYGYDKEVLRVSSADFYTPEFDGLGAEAITYGEVFNNPRVVSSVSLSNQTMDYNIFGFTERYNAYRYGKDKITGDFRALTTTDASTAYNGTAMNTWHTGRMLTTLRDNGNMLAQATDFMTQSQTDSEYNRIFQNATENADHFYMTAQFKVSAIRPMLNLNQVPRLGEGSTSVPRNGNEVN